MTSPLQDTSGRDEWAGRRADARRNHDDVFAAAVEVFAERGEDATIPEVAARAGVGKATVYRSYPTKAALVDAVARDQVAWLDGRIHEAHREPDAFEALSGLLGDICQRIAADRLFLHVLIRKDQWNSGLDRVEVLDGLLRDAKRQGRLRDDATVEDIRVMVGGFTRSLLELDVRDPAKWRRYATLVLKALSPDG